MTSDITTKDILKSIDTITKDIQLSTVDIPWKGVSELLNKPVFNFLFNKISGFILIYNFNTGFYEYCSQSVKGYLGFDRDYFTKIPSNTVLLSLLENSQASIFTTIMSKIFHYISIGSSRDVDFKYSVSMKVKNIHNVYRWYMFDSIVIHKEKSGSPLRSLTTCSCINEVKKDEVIYYSVSKKDKNGIYRTVLKGCEVPKNNIYNLTKKELMILELIGEGLTSKQITERITMSINTLKTHKKNISAKTGCSGIPAFVKLSNILGITQYS